MDDGDDLGCNFEFGTWSGRKRGRRAKKDEEGRNC
jgi:hypothetical protein